MFLKKGKKKIFLNHNVLVVTGGNAIETEGAGSDPQPVPQPFSDIRQI